MCIGRLPHQLPDNSRVLSTNGLPRLIVFPAFGQGIRAQNFDVTLSGYFVTELFEPNRRIYFTFRPQTTCAFTANGNPGMFFTCLRSGLAQAPDGLEHSNRVRR